MRVSNPDRVYFPATGATKLDLVDYYLAVGPGIVNAVRERPCMLHRFPTGLSGAKVHQKRVPGGAPPWLGTVRVHFPRYGLHADELCVTELAEVIWAVQMSTVEFHPWNSRRADVERPDEWRIDLDPMPESARSRRCAASPMWCTRCSMSSGPSVGRRRRGARGCTCTCASSRRSGSMRCAPRHWRSRVRSSVAPGQWSRPRGGARTATRRRCSSTTTRTRVITRSRRPTR